MGLGEGGNEGNDGGWICFGGSMVGYGGTEVYGR